PRHGAGRHRRRRRRRRPGAGRPAERPDPSDRARLARRAKDQDYGGEDQLRGDAQRQPDGRRDLAGAPDRGPGERLGRRDLLLDPGDLRPRVPARGRRHGRPGILAAGQRVLHLLRAHAGEPRRRDPPGEPRERLRTGGRRSDGLPRGPRLGPGEGGAGGVTAPPRIDDALFGVPETAALRRAALQILAQALSAVDAYAVTHRALRRERDTLTVGGRTFPLPAGARVIVVGAGKACAPMARAVEDVLGDRIGAGLITVKAGYTAPLQRIVLREAGHPLPDAAGETAARDVLALVSGLGPNDLVVCLISGGGSALLPVPREGLTLSDKARTTNLLLRSGADITEINTVRKHLSLIKGGQLARAASPARLVTLVISDIVGSPSTRSRRARRCPIPPPSSMRSRSWRSTGSPSRCRPPCWRPCAAAPPATS